MVIDFGHVSDRILELLWLLTLAMFPTVFWNCCGYFRLYFGTIMAIDFAHVSDCILELLWRSDIFCFSIYVSRIEILFSELIYLKT